MILFTIVTAFLVIIDQLIKFFIESNLYGKSIDIIGNIFSFTYLENNGAAWGILSENNWILSVSTPIIILAIIYYLVKYRRNDAEFFIGALVVGGAIGNYIDRIFRGYVIDYIDFKIWPVFNFADICIVIGCILFSINLIVRENKDAI